MFRVATYDAVNDVALVKTGVFGSPLGFLILEPLVDDRGVWW